jgi:hypothetical protein
MTEVSFLHVFAASLLAEALRLTVLNPADLMKQVSKVIMGEGDQSEIDPMT